MPLPQPEGKLFYLASPYSHKCKIIKEYRYFLVAAAAAELYQAGFNLLEPIGSGHPIAIRYDLPQGYEYWQKRDRLMIERSDGVIVLTIPGWAESVGVTDEIKYAKELGKPVYYVNPAELLPGEVLANGPYRNPGYTYTPNGIQDALGYAVAAGAEPVGNYIGQAVGNRQVPAQQAAYAAYNAAADELYGPDSMELQAPDAIDRYDPTNPFELEE